MSKDNKKVETKQCTIPSVSGSYVFDRELLLKIMNKKVEYFIGVDTYDANANAYCLTQIYDGKSTVLLSNVKMDKTEFEEEVKNLAKYFNAKVLSQ